MHLRIPMRRHMVIPGHMPVLIPDPRIIPGIIKMAMEVLIKAVITKIPAPIIITEAIGIRLLMLKKARGTGKQEPISRSYVLLFNFPEYIILAGRDIVHC